MALGRQVSLQAGSGLRPRPAGPAGTGLDEQFTPGGVWPGADTALHPRSTAASPRRVGGPRTRAGRTVTYGQVQQGPGPLGFGLLFWAGSQQRPKPHARAGRCLGKGPKACPLREHNPGSLGKLQDAPGTAGTRTHAHAGVAQVSNNTNPSYRPGHLAAARQASPPALPAAAARARRSLTCCSTLSSGSACARLSALRPLASRHCGLSAAASARTSDLCSVPTCGRPAGLEP